MQRMEVSLSHSHAVIMAGGGGTRLWPISRQKHPKHLLPLLGTETLFQMTVKRLEGLLPPERILVVTTKEQVDSLKTQCSQVPADNFILEPQGRGTAAVAGLAATNLLQRDSQAVMLLLPSDHYIGNPDQFRILMRAAVLVADEHYLVTLGVQPTFASTGYGYIQRGDPLAMAFTNPVYNVVRFTEKPEPVKAQVLLESGDHYWNSGMFISRADRILDEIKLRMPDLSSVLAQIGAAYGTYEGAMILERLWRDLPNITIDYGLMEKAEHVAVLEAAGLDWSDVGSWSSLFEVLPMDNKGNISINCEHLALGTKGTLVYSTHKKLVATLGIENLIVIDSGDALLICRKEEAQQVRQVIESLKATQYEDYL